MWRTSSILRAISPWLACLVVSATLLFLLSACDSPRPRTEHPPGGAWYAVGDRLPYPSPLYLAKARQQFARVDDGRDALPPGTDEPEAVLALTPWPLSEYDDYDGSGPAGGWVASVWAQAPFPSMAGPAIYKREYTDESATAWQIVRAGVGPCPVGVVVYEIEDDAARLGILW